MAKDINALSGPSHNGQVIPPWSVTAQEYEVLYHFPDFTKRFDIGRDCLTLRERFDLQILAEQCQVSSTPPLQDKVSLLVGGNLAHIEVDAVVNASNCWLTSGKGVNGAIHAGAGWCLLEECVRLGGCKVGEAKLSGGYDLPARHVIHTVGPAGKDKNRADKMRNCYHNSLKLCLQHNIKTVAFPCISTGQYCYPSVEAANVVLSTVREWLLTDENCDKMERIIFVTRTVKDEEAYSTLMLKYFPVK